MLELPELDIYRAHLAERFAGARITDLTINNKLRTDGNFAFEEAICGTTVWFVERRARHILFHLDNGKRLLIHFSPKAYVYCSAPDENAAKGQSASIEFGDRSLHVYGLQSGDLELLSVKEVENKLKPFGVDPLDKRFTFQSFLERTANRKGVLKSVLLDQTFLSGIGAMYADEIAFAAALLPDAKLSELEEQSWIRLYESIGEVLKDAIAHGGAGKQPMFEGDVLTGGFSERLQVYGREGQSCMRCGGTVEKLKAGVRQAYACRGCQSAH